MTPGEDFCKHNFTLRSDRVLGIAGPRSLPSLLEPSWSHRALLWPLGPALLQGFLPLSCYFYSIHFLLLPTEGPLLTKEHNPPHVTLPMRTFCVNSLSPLRPRPKPPALLSEEDFPTKSPAPDPESTLHVQVANLLSSKTRSYASI